MSSLERKSRHLFAKCIVKYADSPLWSADDDEDTSCYVTDTSDVHSYSDSDVDQADDELSEGESPLKYGRLKLIKEEDVCKNSEVEDEGFEQQVEKERIITRKQGIDDILDENNNSSDEKKVECMECALIRSEEELPEPIESSPDDLWEFIRLDIVKISSTRWFVLCVVCASIFVRSLVSVVFGQVNDVFAEYYNVLPGAVDWLTTTGFLATLVVAPFVVKLGRNRASLRQLCCLMTGTASIGTILLTAAVTSREHGFPLAIAGQAVMGANNAVAMTIPPLVAAVWFPESETATALAFSFVSVGAGDALGSYIPPALIVTSESEQESGSGSIRFRLVAMFACTAGASILTFVVSLVYVAERPTFPPSKAQLTKIDIRRARDSPAIVNGQTSALFPGSSATVSCRSRSIARDLNFLLVALFYGVSAACGANSITLLSSSMSQIFPEERENVDATSGKIVSLMFVFFSVGPMVAGRLLDRTKRYRATALLGMTGLTLGTTGITLSLFYKSVTGLYASHAAVGFFMGVAETALFEIAAKITYPRPEMDFSCVLVMSWMFFFVLHPLLGRRALNARLMTSPVIASLFPAACTLACLLLALPLLRPQLGITEREGDEDSQSGCEESTPLLLSV